MMNYNSKAIRTTATLLKLISMHVRHFQQYKDHNQFAATNDLQLAAYTYISFSPRYLEYKSEEVTEKNVVFTASVATALAKYVLPTPGAYKQTKT